ncbi:hypothetical protein GI374_11460 [Paracoccus sp. S-4012]|uniref:FliM/FliN family flagellar motor C-terminal domain-containing protein n=1 Tax=Paracoccus sp. S-4012 TaxID=2665648 RepID=UPI0012B0213D|nr:FliM/FliN family flagellar motor C-terminal domain-containing protein [Paracoccus sp. S-4012]MRX51054.1 hypothetical protein [Paracoccus sp. S-4012]
MDRGRDMAGGVLRGLLKPRAAPVAPAGGVAVPPPPPPSLERAVAGALARAAERTHGLALYAERIRLQGLSLAEIAETLPEGGLLAVVEGPGEALGVVALCPLAVAALIEMQAMGRLAAQAPAARRPTRTDAAIAAGFVNQALAEIAAATAALPFGAGLEGYRYASHLDDPRPLPLMLEEVGFRAIDARLRLGPGGRREARVFIALPGPDAVGRKLAEPAAAPAPVNPPKRPRRTLAAAVAAAPVPLTAVLCRRSVTLRELRQLAPGATLTLPRAALGEVTLETATGQTVARGRLGENDGAYAVRLHGREDAGGAGPQPAEPPIADLGLPDAFRQETMTAAASAWPRPEDSADDTLPAAAP